MKRYLLIFLAFQILVTSLPTSQGIQSIMKLGAFIHHFTHHLAYHEEEIGVVDFIKLHLFEHDHHESDHEQHDNLPFHHHHHDHDHQNIVLQTVYWLSASQSFATFLNLEIFSNPLILCSMQWHSSLYAGEIWQPPKA